MPGGVGSRVLENGRVVLEGNARALSRARLKEAYLGG
jgi:ABC-type branched-subunit amino acid transport system ATPase component